MRLVSQVIIVMSAFIVSCQQIISVDVPYSGPSLVVNSVLETGETLEIYVARDAHILEEEGNGSDDNVSKERAISGASIIVRDNGELVTGIIENENGKYTSSMIVQAGHDYDITVAKEGFETVTSFTSIPSEGVEIEDISFSEGQDVDGLKVTYVRFSFDDDPSSSDYYEIMVAVKVPEDREATYDTIYFSEDSSEFIVTKNRENYFFEEEPDIVVGDSSFVSLYSEIRGSEFESSPAVYGKSVYFSDELFTGVKKTVDLSVDIPYYFPSDNNEDFTSSNDYYVFVRKCSADYYEYLSSVKQQDWNTGDPLAQPVIIRGNIENGFGLFGGYSQTYRKFDE